MDTDHIHWKTPVNGFDWFLIFGGFAIIIAYAMLNADYFGDFNYLYTFTLLASLVSVVLAAHAKMTCYLFGLLNVVLYLFYAYKSHLLGEGVLYAVYFLPLQFIGLSIWRKRQTGRHHHHNNLYQLQVRFLSDTTRLVTITATIVVCLVVGYGLDTLKAMADNNDFIVKWHLYSNYPYIYAIMLVTTVLAQFFMAGAYVESWILNMVSNIASILLFVQYAQHGELYFSGLMVIMHAFCLANAFNGIRIWLKLPRERS